MGVGGSNFQFLIFNSQFAMADRFVCAGNEHLGVLGGVAVGAIASFLVGTFILRVYPVRQQETDTAAATKAPAQRPVTQPA